MSVARQGGGGPIPLGKLRPKVIAAMCRHAAMLLDGVGHGEGWWDEIGPDHKAVHLRRHLSMREQLRVGGVVDVRGTDYEPRYAVRGMEDEMMLPAPVSP